MLYFQSSMTDNINENFVKRHHVYKTIWSIFIGEAVCKQHKTLNIYTFIRTYENDAKEVSWMGFL